MCLTLSCIVFAGVVAKLGHQAAQLGLFRLEGLLSSCFKVACEFLSLLENLVSLLPYMFRLFSVDMGDPFSRGRWKERIIVLPRIDFWEGRGENMTKALPLPERGRLQKHRGLRLGHLDRGDLRSCRSTVTSAPVEMRYWPSKTGSSASRPASTSAVTKEV